MKIINFYRQLLKENHHWLRRAFFWSLAWFIFGALFYGFWPESKEFIQEYLRSFFEDVAGDAGFGINFSTFWLILKNNLLAGALALFLGILLALPPLLSLAINFFVIGYILAFFITGYPEGFLAGLGIFSLTVIPHGIIEIPAFLLVGAFGMKLGFFWLKGDSTFKQTLKEIFQILPLLIFLFAFAALVEVFITGRIALWLTS